MMRQLLAATASLMGVSAMLAETPQSAYLSDYYSGLEMAMAESDNSTEAEMSELVSLILTEEPAGDEKVRYETLTEEDFQIVADELGVDIATIKAVVKIEAGPKLQGFWAPGVPVANYVQSLFNKYKAKTKGRKLKDAKVPSGLSGYALKEWTSLTNARKINADAADMGTYWGMFQIGGFNYKLCGCSSVEEMVQKVCQSEFSQLEMFAVFIRNAGMLESLQKKDWAAFARKYNGPSYAKRGYHTRMANEYANFKSKESSTTTDENTGAATTQIGNQSNAVKTSAAAPKTTTATKKKATTGKKKRRKSKRTTK